MDILNKKYKVIKLLGQGAMGKVYLVSRLKDSKELVVKELIFNPSGTSVDVAKEIFKREAEFMSHFNNPGLPKIYETFTYDDREFIVMDYIKGKTLEEIINETQYNIAETKAIKWIIELAEILDYLHNSFSDPIVYRDLKPSNIIISPENEAKLVDFGIVRYYIPDKDTDTFSLGSPGYAAPEQYKGKGQSTPQTDIFSLGVILFQLLTEYDPTFKPFSFPSMIKLKPSIKKELEEIVINAIKIDPLDRHSSIKVFKNRLEKYLKVYYEYDEINNTNEDSSSESNDLNKKTGSGCLAYLVGCLLFVFYYITIRM